MLTTDGETAFAIVRNVEASTGPLSGALFAGSVASVDCADEAGDRSNREAMTMPTASEATAISSA